MKLFSLTVSYVREDWKDHRMNEHYYIAALSFDQAIAKAMALKESPTSKKLITSLRIDSFKHLGALVFCEKE